MDLTGSFCAEALGRAEKAGKENARKAMHAGLGFSVGLDEDVGIAFPDGPGEGGGEGYPSQIREKQSTSNATTAPEHHCCDKD